MNVLIDINVVLDVFMAREPWLQDSTAVFQANHDRRIVGHLSAVSFPTIFYILRRHAGAIPAERAIANCLAAFEVIEVNATTLRQALILTGEDFEDRLQAACAINAGMDAVVTRDPSGFTGAPIVVLSPRELISRLASQS